MTRDDNEEGRGGRGEGRGRGRGERGGPEGRGRRGGWQVADLPPAVDAADWFRGRLPDGWFSEIEVRTDREEITVLGTLSDSQADGADGRGDVGIAFPLEAAKDRSELNIETGQALEKRVGTGLCAATLVRRVKLDRRHSQIVRHLQLYS